MSISEDSLRDSIVQSLKAEPLLVEVEEVLHSFDATTASQKLREGLILSLDAAPLQAEVDGAPYEDIEQDHVRKLRTALEDTLKTGASVTDAEREVLKSIGFEKLGEFRSLVQAHLDGPAEIPDEDLAIYVPEGEGRREAFRDAIEEQIRELGIQPDMPIDEVELGLEELVEVEAQKEEEVLAQASVEVTVPVEEMIEITAAETGEVITGLNPVPMLTAALEATGVDGVDFGFLLRYGRYAPEGRKSEFLVGGIGMAELSDRLAAWLKANGSMDAQVQVVDEGSGELMIYLLEKEI
ncbi:MAG: hypothetical protein ACFE9C_17115 [Candidatus Hodarchaeota archaeon]